MCTAKPRGATDDNVEGIAWLSRDTLVAVSDSAARPLRREGSEHPSIQDPGRL